jgi:murein DD-endopeptidase MepM/ murein hydrolase activator NlpD
MKRRHRPSRLFSDGWTMFLTRTHTNGQRHLVTIALTAAFTAIAAAIFLALRQSPAPAPRFDETSLDGSIPVAPTGAFAPSATPVEPPLQVATLDIRRRDTLVGALLRHDVPAAVAHEIATALDSAGADLRRVRPGDRVELASHADGRVARVSYAPSAWTRFHASDSDGVWRGERSDVTPDVRVEAYHGEVSRSLWQAADAAGVDPQVLLGLVRIFESEFDFTADTRAGDRFRLLVVARFADGVRADYGRVLAAQYVSDGRTLTGVAFEADGRVAWYDAGGRSLRKAFLRSPLEFSRISSGFTYRRPHPILGGVRPHLAIDYAAPTGTPVWAVADALVKFAGRNGGNGIQVVLQHRGGYVTYYNHLSRVAPGVKPGARVEQKQVIGYVGSTGLSTGPHLDYRVAKHGAFVNPLAEDFLPGEPVPAADRARFAAQAQELIARLERDAPFAAPSAPPESVPATSRRRPAPAVPRSDVSGSAASAAAGAGT